MSNLKVRFELLRFALECLSYFVVIGGIGLFFWEQKRDRQAQREEMAMRFVALSSEPGYVEAREQLVAPFRPYKMKELSPAAISRIVSKVDPRYFEQMESFYSTVLICRDVRCDKETIDKFFKAEIKSFYCHYRTRIRQTQERLDRPDYAADLRGYAGACTGD